MEEINGSNPIDPAINHKTKPKKRHRFIKFLISFVIIIAIAVLSLNHFVPGLLTTKDLGVKYSNEDYESAVSKLSTIRELLPSLSTQNDTTYNYGETKDIDIRLTSAEITAFLNTDKSTEFAAKNCQVSINNDNTIEASGAINVDYFLSEILNGKISREQIVKEIPALGILPSYVNLYIDFSGSIIDNQSSASINSVAVQGITIPNEFVNSKEATDVFTTGINTFLSKNNEITGSSIDTLIAENNEVVLKGKFPSSVSINQ